MSSENTSLRVYLSADEYKDIKALAEEKHISLSAAAKLAIDFYRDNKDVELNTAALINPIIKQLNDYLIKQKQMIEGELKYFGKTSRDLTQTNLIYGHILNSMLWKMNCSDRDFIAQNSNSNPVFSRSIDQAVVQIKALRQKKMSADKKYQDKAMSNVNK